MARFIAAQLIRGRAAREALSKFISDTQSQMLSLAAQHYADERWREILGEELNPEMRERLINNKVHLEINPTNAFLLRTLLSPIDEVSEMLEMRTWTLIRFNEPCLFTSEHPVIYLNEGPNPMPHGVATADQIYFPLSTT